MESLQAEVAPFGIATTIVNPGFFRTELLTRPAGDRSGFESAAARGGVGQSRGFGQNESMVRS